MVAKIDFKRELAGYRATKDRFEVIDVPSMTYLMIDGHGDPNTSPAFSEAIETLYPVAYKIKFASKIDKDRDYVVPPLEGLWWAEDMESFTTARDKSKWSWTLMLMTPEWISLDDFSDAVEQVAAKKQIARLGDIRFETLDEGTCVQTLHIGSFDAEAQVLARLHDEFVPNNGFGLTGKHHEIYLSDFRKVEPDRQRTILRQPVFRFAA